MGITRGQLRKLGFKKVKEDLIYSISRLSNYEMEHNLYNYLYLGKNKTVIFYINRDQISPLIHLDDVGFKEMQDFLRNIKNNSWFTLKNQIESI